MTPLLRDTIAELATANRILAREGVLDAFGHVSVRHPEHSDRYLLSCSRSAAQVVTADIMVFDLSGAPVDDDRPVFLERFIHAGVYEARPDVGAVVHNHSPDLIPYGVTDTPIRPLVHVGGCIGERVRTWDIRDNFGDTSMLVTGMEHARDLAEGLGADQAALMRGHGAVVTGSTLRECVLRSIYLQLNARLDLQARQLGAVNYLTPGEIALGEPTLLHDNPAARAWSYFAARAGGEPDQ